jgi:hypothetical protein
MAVRLPAEKRMNITCFASEVSAQQTNYRLTLPIMEMFSEKDLAYNKDSPQFTTGYSRINQFFTEGNGQMSMLLLEIFFLCKCVPKDQESIVVYPGDHINFLSQMFEKITFHLYDPLIMIKIRETDRVIKHHQAFDDAEANKYVGKGVYYISDIRNTTYNRNNTPERNSIIIDNDMYLQLKWAQIMKPVFSLIRFRPKLPTERATVSSFLTDSSHPNEKRQLYYNYPIGYLLKIPLPKRNPNSMFLITNDYTPNFSYYHDDMLSMINHHNYYIRTAVIYDNPFVNYVSQGFFGEEDIVRFIQTHFAGKTIGSDLTQYACGVDWDHRAMVYIMTMYIKYIKDMRPTLELLKAMILEPYISMRELSNQEEEQNQT